MKVYLIAHTEQPEQVVAAAAKLCYSDSEVSTLMNDLTPEKTESFIDTLLNQLGHESPIEHASFTFAIEGVSRSLLAQITRHRHASYSVQSQRYVKLKDFNYVIPPVIAEDEAALAVFEAAMLNDRWSYNEITKILYTSHLQQYLKTGIDQKTAESQAEKKAIEDARFVFPNACETKMVMTMNARSLQNFFRQRCCRRAQWEIRALADEMLKLVCEKAPTIFKNAGPPCIKSRCSEGKMSCGMSEEVRNYYRELKENI
ncbi:MAG: FAD-dependent thymidylate synthase [Oscillospiraceae bacterium]|nr:FAD-dependent thymidylate synthase [Oscillospiraceae bacterium]